MKNKHNLCDNRNCENAGVSSLFEKKLDKKEFFNFFLRENLQQMMIWIDA